MAPFPLPNECFGQIEHAEMEQSELLQPASSEVVFTSFQGDAMDSHASIFLEVFDTFIEEDMFLFRAAGSAASVEAMARVADMATV